MNSEEILTITVKIGDQDVTRAYGLSALEDTEHLGEQVQDMVQSIKNLSEDKF